MAFKISAVVESIKQPITKDYLLNYVANYGFRDDHAMMPPPQNAHPHPHGHGQHHHGAPQGQRRPH